ncbi:MAG: hypothetical protein P8X63_08395 [Desulfuromonadaceae bacterium]
MKNTFQIIVVLLTLLLLSGADIWAAEQDQESLYVLHLNRSTLATESSPSQSSPPPTDVVQQLANLFNYQKGLTINDTTSIFLLCSQMDPLQTSDSPEDLLMNVGVGLKINF